MVSLGVGADYFKWAHKNKFSSSTSVGGMLSKASGAIVSMGTKKGGYVCMYLHMLYVCVTHTGDLILHFRAYSTS